MADIELTDIVDALSRLQLNYTSLAEQFYNIFFNPVPMNVTLVFIDKEGEEVEVTIPNRAKDQKYIINGEGSPVQTLTSADIGTIYQDILNGEVYVKYGDDSDEWTLLISKNELDSIIRQVQGSPEGSEIAPIGTLCVDTQNGYMYMKRTSSGNTGWVRIDSYATSKITEVFTFTRETSSLVLNGTCENKNVMNIYEDGLKLNPDIYDMPYGDNKTVIFRRPIKTPGEGETTEVVVEYYIDIHVAESSAEQRLVDYVKEARFYSEGISPEGFALNYIAEVDEKVRPEGDTSEKRYLSDIDTETLNEGDFFYCILEECFCIWDGNHWLFEYSAHYWRDQAEDIYNKANFDITEAEQAIAEAGAVARQQFQELYDETYNLVVTMREYIDENYEKFTAGVNRVENYAQQVSKHKTAVEIMLEEVKQLEHNTYNYADYVETHVNDFATKTEFNTFKDDLEAEVAESIANLTSDINDINVNLTATINEINDTLSIGLADEISERTKADNKLQGTIDFNQSTFENWTASHSDLGDFNNAVGYFKRDNSPIDLNGIYKYSKNIWKTEEEKGTNIVLTAVKDCSYYVVDFGDYMESTTMADTSFDFTIQPDRYSIDFSLPDKLDNDGYTKDFNNVVCVIRCYIKNESVYTPSIDWDYTKITWLGSEPELEPKKSYIVEFISYDMMTSWEAHILGICQPAIELDTFTSTFTVNCSAISGLESGDTSEVKMVAIIDGRELTLDDTYEFDNTTGKVTVPMEIERKFLGKTLSEIQLKSTNTPAFSRFYAGSTSGSGVPIVLNQNQSYTITCGTSAKTVKYNYSIHINSEIIETYMRGGLSLEDYNNYPAQQEMEANLGYNFIVDELPEDGGDGLYVLTSDLTTYWTWYESMGEWKSSNRIVPTSSFITSLNVTGKFTFSEGNIGPSDTFTETYYYDPNGNIQNNGVIFNFDSSDGIMSDPLVSRVTDTYVSKVKVRYDDYAAGYCVSADDILPVKIDGGAYVNAESVETW